MDFFLPNEAKRKNVAYPSFNYIFRSYKSLVYPLKVWYSQKLKFSHYLLTLMLMESQINFLRPQNIPEALWLHNVFLV